MKVRTPIKVTLRLSIMRAYRLVRTPKPTLERSIARPSLLDHSALRSDA